MVGSLGLPSTAAGNRETISDRRLFSAEVSYVLFCVRILYCPACKHMVLIHNVLSDCFSAPECGPCHRPLGTRLRPSTLLGEHRIIPVPMTAKRSPYQAVALGCVDTELVLRGGYLKAPMVMTRLSVVDGDQYMSLWKSSPELAKFLFHGCSHSKQLKHMKVFETLACLRNAAIKASQIALVLSPADSAEPDLADQLDLDAEHVSATGVAGTVRSRKMSFAKASKLLPRTVMVTCKRAGQLPWQPRVLVEAPHKAPAIQATSENLQILFSIVDNEATHGGDDTDAPVARKAIKEPRGGKGDREYWNGKHWLRKTVVGRMGAPSRPFARKVRVLKRRGTEEGTEASCRPVLVDETL